MPWQCTVTLDADKTDVGTANAVFTDADSSVFNHVERLRVTTADRNAFVGRAIAARDAWRTRKTSEATYKTSVESRFTAVGETVG